MLARALQIAGLCGVGLVLFMNLWPSGITMVTMLQFTGISVLLFLIGTGLLKGQQ